MHNIRYQYAVGQGCFHAGIVSASSNGLAGPGIRYVYDCGSLSTYAAARDAEIAAFHAETQKARIDLLFLSHMHEDHVSGVEKICDGVPVDTVVLPLLNAIDRLISFARAAAESPGAEDEFMRAMTIDPVGALLRLNPRQIIVVRRGAEGGSPAPGEAGPGAPDGPIDGGERDGRRDLAKWRLVGRGRVRRSDLAPQDSPALSSAQHVFEIDDTFGFAISVGPDSGEAWLLAPYVDEEVSMKRTDFIKTAADLFGLTPEEFEAATASPSWLVEAVTEHKSQLAEAYGSIANLNVTSLCLYSGPFTAGLGHWSAHAGALSYGGRVSHSVGWFGTGDADLKKMARRAAFKKHYASYLTKAQTLLLPHHGSEHNFDPDILTAIEPGLTVASAAPYKTWRHPGSAVVQAVASNGHPVWVVTEAQDSRIREFIHFPSPDESVPDV